ncbi:hypothetical protein SNEBB_003754 [Seison nebaliae]|nr:hypothetical protein SNEBB_003754 [Seison nebaliae]
MNSSIDSGHFTPSDSTISTQDAYVQLNLSHYGWNPMPNENELSESEHLLTEYLSPTRLKQLTEVKDLNDVKKLELIIDMDRTSFGNFGHYMPNLKELRLTDSFITKIRNLGTQFKNLTILFMGNCGLEDLEGIGTSMPNLSEAYLPFNRIKEIGTSLSLLDNLRILDLEDNLIEDIEEIEFLRLNKHLTSLVLRGNKCCDGLMKDWEGKKEMKLDRYRRRLFKYLPHLKQLDESSSKKLRDKDQSNPSNSSTFSSHWSFINECLDKGLLKEKIPSFSSPSPSPSSNISSTISFDQKKNEHKSFSNIRPGTSLSLKSPAISNRSELTLTARPKTAMRNLTETPSLIKQLFNKNDKFFQEPTDNYVSDLTKGAAIQGNLTRALFRNRRPNKSEWSTEHSSVNNTRNDSTNEELDDIRKECQQFQQRLSSSLPQRQLLLENRLIIETDDEDEGEEEVEIDEITPRSTSIKEDNYHSTHSNNIRNEKNWSKSMDGTNETIKYSNKFIKENKKNIKEKTTDRNRPQISERMTRRTFVVDEKNNTEKFHKKPFKNYRRMDHANNDTNSQLNQINKKYHQIHSTNE